MLTIKNLHVSIGGKQILNGIDLTVKPGEIHAIMGPNGSGKSTLAYALMGHPEYNVQIANSKSQIAIRLDRKSIIKLSPDERARLGLFLAFQSPVAIPGVSVGKFLRHIAKSKQNKSKKTKTLSDAIAINKDLDSLAESLHIKSDLLKRDLNDNFSGGEKKKIETLQMLFLKPKYAIVDEVDTGLDVDALKVVAKGIKKLVQGGNGIIIITHYNRILKHVKPDRVHVMRDGKIVKSGSAALAKRIEDKGYSKI